MLGIAVRFLILVGAVCLAASARAGGGRDGAFIPLGSIRLADGQQAVALPLPVDPAGVIESPLVLVALFDAKQAGDKPITIDLTAGPQRYPTWSISQPGQMYVIGTAAIARDASDGRPALRLAATVQNAPQGVALMLSAAPDLRLAGPAALGPLERVVEALPRSAAREYLDATLKSAGADLAGARRDFERLASSSDEAVARFARAALRRIRFAEVEASAARDANTQQRLGLYAYQTGMFRAARLHFEAALAADAARSELWLRLAEMMDRCGDPPAEVAEALDRAGRTAHATAVNWDVLVAVIPPEAGASAAPGGTAEADPLAARIRGEWELVQRMIYGASRGRLRLTPRFVRVGDPTAAGFRALEAATGDERAVNLLAPPDGLVRAPQPAEWVVVQRSNATGATVARPLHNGAGALSDLSLTAGWGELFVALCRVLDVTARRAEQDDVFPLQRFAAGAGAPPNASLPGALRAGLASATPAQAFLRIAPTVAEGSQGLIRNWYVAPATGDATGGPGALGPGRLKPPARFVTTENDHLDLATVLGQGEKAAANGGAWASAYLLSARRQDAALHLTTSAPAALWLNDDPILTGRGGASDSDARQGRAVVAPVTLLKGWNRIDVAFVGGGPPQLRLNVLDPFGRPISDLKQAGGKTDIPAISGVDPLAPQAGEYYDWDEVRDDWQRKLPRLTSETLRKCGEFPTGLTLDGFILRGGDVVAVAAPDDAARGADAALAPRPASWDPARDSDLRLNNLLDWARESALVYPYRKSGGPRHLLLLKPEAVEPFLACLREAPEAATVLGARPLRKRVLGYVRIDGADSWRALIALETLLPTPLPADEDDLLSPR